MNIQCNKCKSDKVVKAGFKKLKNKTIQRYKCKNCNTFFTGREKYSRLSESDKSKILKEFIKGKSLNQVAIDFNVRLYTVQYFINKVRKAKPENEELYQRMMKNRVRTDNEIFKIQQYYKKKQKPISKPKIIPSKPIIYLPNGASKDINNSLPPIDYAIKLESF